MATANTLELFFRAGKTAQKYLFKIDSDSNAKIYNGLIVADQMAYHAVLTISDVLPYYLAILHVNLPSKGDIRPQDYEYIREQLSNSLCRIIPNQEEGVQLKSLTALSPSPESLPMTLEALFSDTQKAINLIESHPTI